MTSPCFFSVSFQKRFKLFDSTVTSSVMWCAESWTPRADELQRLKVAQRAMIRRIHGGRRVPEEPWLEWIRRVTPKALQIAKDAKVRDWVNMHFERKWNWAGHIARRPCIALTSKVSFWRDSVWQDIEQEMGSQRTLRPSRRRWMRFEDTLRRFCAERGMGT